MVMMAHVLVNTFARYPEDIKIMKELGVQSYRFSIAWPRILPTGLETTGNTKGLDFYNRLVDALLEAGIEPWVTLYHWDLPQVHKTKEAGKVVESLTIFLIFSDIMSRSLGDRVKHWITLQRTMGCSTPWILCR